jgi:hypothetical protein
MTALPSRPVPRLAALLCLWIAGAVTLLVVPPSTPAVAQPDPAGLDRMKELYRQALTDYAAQDFESSRIGLREAISVGERAGLGRDPLMARVLMAYGAVLLNGYNDKARADRALTGAAILVPDLLPAEGMGSAALTKAIAVARAKARVRARAMGMPQGAATPAAGEAPAAPSETPAATEALPEAPAGGAAAGGTEGGFIGPPPVATGPVSGTLPVPEADQPAPGAPAVAPAPSPPAPVARRKRRKGPGEEPDLPANIPQPLYCPSVDEAPPEEDIVLHCVLRPDLAATKVMVFFRPAGQETFSSSGATRSPAGWYRATIPGRVVEGRSLQYYLEARDPKGNPVANAGRDDSPNLLLVREEAAPLGKLYAGIARRRTAADDDYGDDADDPPPEDDPLRAVARQRERERQMAGRHVRRPGAIFGGLAAGSGYGWHPASKLEFYEKSTIEAGWIPSGRFQMVPEIGYQLNEQLAVSLVGRVQFIAQKGSGDQQPGKPASGAFLVLGRLQYFLGAGNLQTSLSLYGGGGDGFRLTIDPIPPNLRNDSVRGGPLCAGAGVGILYHFTEHVALAVDAKTLYGFPTTAAVVDGTTGLQFSF